MDAVVTAVAEPVAIPLRALEVAPPLPQLLPLVLPALRIALREIGEHRLYQTGKLPGLFASRHGLPAEAARFALSERCLEQSRTELRGKQVVEWVRATPRAVEFVEEHDSPKTVLHDLRAVIGETRAGVPVWLAETKDELAEIRNAFEGRARLFLDQLDALTVRVEAALRRVELAPGGIPDAAIKAVSWALNALEYLDRRTFMGVPGDCPLSELFRAVRDHHSSLTLAEFHVGVRRLHDLRTLKLVAGTHTDTEFGLVIGSEVCCAARR